MLPCWLQHKKWALKSYAHVPFKWVGKYQMYSQSHLSWLFWKSHHQEATLDWAHHICKLSSSWRCDELVSQLEFAWHHYSFVLLWSCIWDVSWKNKFYELSIAKRFRKTAFFEQENRRKITYSHLCFFSNWHLFNWVSKGISPLVFLRKFLGIPAEKVDNMKSNYPS